MSDKSQYFTISFIALTTFYTFAVSVLLFPGLAQTLPNGFIHLSDVDKTILQEMRYAGHHNFVGWPIYGPPVLNPFIKHGRITAN